MLDTIQDVVVVLNRHRQIVFANRALLDLTGESNADSYLGLRPGEALNCVHAFEERSGCGTTEFCSQCGAVLAILTAIGHSTDVRECRIIQRSGGDALELLVCTTPIDIDGEPFVFASISDISHEKRRRALERIFFHDILNIAGAVAGYTDLLSIVKPELSKMVIDNMHLAIKRLIDEIQTQCELLSAENNELKLQHKSIEVRQFLSELASFNVSHEVGKGKHVALAPDLQDITMKSDPVVLGRVLTNMIKNALEASRECGTVTVNCRTAGDKVEFSVHNEGVMPRNTQLQIFQRSFSTRGAGRGIGTYSMKLLSERYLKGEVYFRSAENEGTTFFAKYPRELSE